MARPVMRFATNAVVEVVEQIHAKTVIQPIAVSALKIFQGSLHKVSKHTLHQPKEAIPFRCKSRGPAILSPDNRVPVCMSELLLTGNVLIPTSMPSLPDIRL